MMQVLEQIDRYILKQNSQIHNNFIMQTNKAVAPEGKVAYYRSDGTGRDTYIRDHNGGLLSKDRLHSLCQFKAPKDKNLKFGKTQYNRHPYTYQHGASNKFPHYISDGSGRDFYVKNTDGGNSCPFRWRDQTDYRFKSTLRGHTEFPNVNPEREDIFAKSQMKVTAQEASFRRTFGPVQRQLDLRLSQPKKFKTPPPVQAYFDHKFDSTRVSRICESNCYRNNLSINEQCTHVGKFY